MAKERRKGENNEWVYMETGLGASVYWPNVKKKYEVNNKMGKSRQRQYFKTLEEANAAAELLNEHHNTHGQNFLSLSQTERLSLELYREYYFESQNEGRIIKSIDEIMLDAIRHERQKEESPLFSDVTEVYLPYLKRKQISLEHFETTDKRIAKINEVFGPMMIGDITSFHIQ